MQQTAENKGEFAFSQARAGNGIDHVSAIAEFRLSVALYFLWIALIIISMLLEQTVVATIVATVLLAGILATHGLFFLIAQSAPHYRPPPAAITLAQSIVGMIWATLFAFLTTSPSELVLGMYTSAFMFSMFRVGPRSALHLAIFAVASFGAVVILTDVWQTTAVFNWGALLKVFILAGLMAAMLLYTQLLQRPSLASRQPEPSSSWLAESRAALAEDSQSFNRHYIRAALEREKGRTDRSNHPFSVCLFEINGLDNVEATLGSLTCDQVLNKFAKRLRGELRAMDGFETNGRRQSFGRVGAAQYLIILPGTSLSGASSCADRIRSAVDRRLLEGQNSVTVAAGVVQYQRGELIPTLLNRADNALRQVESGSGKQMASRLKNARKPADVIELRGRRS